MSPGMYGDLDDYSPEHQALRDFVMEMVGSEYSKLDDAIECSSKGQYLMMLIQYAMVHMDEDKRSWSYAFPDIKWLES
jgi:hypothetical protein